MSNQTQTQPDEQHRSLLARIKAKWPNEAKYRVSLESTAETEEEWFIRIDNGFGSDGDGFGYGPTQDEAFQKLERSAANRVTPQECRARKVAALEAELAKLQGEVSELEPA